MSAVRKKIASYFRKQKQFFIFSLLFRRFVLFKTKFSVFTLSKVRKKAIISKSSVAAVKMCHFFDKIQNFSFLHFNLFLNSSAGLYPSRSVCWLILADVN